MQNNADNGTSTENTVTLTDASRAVGKLVARASLAGQTIVIERHGKPVAAIVSFDELQRLRGADRVAA